MKACVVEQSYSLPCS